MDKKNSIREQVKIYDVSTNWGHVKEIFRNEDFYINDLIDDIIKESNKYEQNSIRVEIELCDEPEEPNSEATSAIQYIKVNFLQKLQQIGDIRNLKINTVPLIIDGQDFNHNYIVANFTINDVTKIKQKSIIKKINSIEKAEKIKREKLLKKFKIINGYIEWNNKKIPFQGGEGSVMNLLLKNATFIADGDEIKGNIKTREDLQKIGNFKKKYIYGVLTNIREKIKKNNLPMEVVNSAMGLFSLNIRL